MVQTGWEGTRSVTPIPIVCSQKFGESPAWATGMGRFRYGRGGMCACGDGGYLAMTLMLRSEML